MKEIAGGDGHDEARLIGEVGYRDYLMRDGEYSRKKQTFVGFKDHLKLQPEVLVEELQHFAKLELTIWRLKPADDPDIDAVLERLKQLDTATANPLLLNLLARHTAGKLQKADLLQCVADLESFIIRRFIVGESTKTYGEMFTAAIKSLSDNVAANLREYPWFTVVISSFGCGCRMTEYAQGYW